MPVVDAQKAARLVGQAACMLAALTTVETTSAVTFGPNRTALVPIPGPRNSALPDPAESRLGVAARRLMLTVAPGTTRAFIVPLLAAGKADHGVHCRCPSGRRRARVGSEEEPREVSST
jgi:hypothetical protein